jgi:integrase
MLRDAQVKGAKAADKRYRMKDAQGVFLEVMPTGKKYFRVEYRIAGRLKKETIGQYPEVSLADARRRVGEIKSDLCQGTIPDKVRTASYCVPAAEAAAQSAKEESQKWEVVAEEFLAKRVKEGLVTSTRKKMLRNTRRTYAELGEMDVAEITGIDLLPILRRFEAAGHYEVMRDMRRRMSQVFRYAVATGKARHDPAHMIRDALVNNRPKKRPGLTDAKDVGALMRAIRGYKGEPSTWAALLLTAYTALRSTELRGREWSEIDRERRVWTVPKERMKQHYGRHQVPLSTQALEVLDWLHPWTGSGKLIFPSAHDPSRWMSENTANSALRRMGYDTKTQHCNHGFRTTFSTNLNEMGYNRDWIEKQLSHHDGDDIRTAYNAAMYLEGRSEMMQARGDWLDKVEEIKAA